MFQPARASGQIEFGPEGFLLTWGPEGVEVRATDYHCTQLRMSWDRLFELARRSGWRPEDERDERVTRRR